MQESTRDRFLETAHGTADFFDDADTFMTQNPAATDRRHVTLQDMQIRATMVVRVTFTITSVGWSSLGTGTSCQLIFPGPE